MIFLQYGRISATENEADSFLKNDGWILWYRKLHTTVILEMIWSAFHGSIVEVLQSLNTYQNCNT